MQQLQCFQETALIQSFGSSCFQALAHIVGVEALVASDVDRFQAAFEYLDFDNASLKLLRRDKGTGCDVSKGDFTENNARVDYCRKITSVNVRWCRM